ncbi:chaplin family protein [Streptomyces sp. NPDC029003]|uniref:chaplin family protein n=1 Tax=Streptomyces sp. NPDC029003 TaxID=3155125 RepID=UPI003410C515
MTFPRSSTALALTAAALGAGALTATPATAGGIGDFLSPAFGTNCANLQNGAHAAGTTTRGSGGLASNLAALPVNNPLNHCGGADFVGQQGQQGLPIPIALPM